MRESWTAFQARVRRHLLTRAALALVIGVVVGSIVKVAYDAEWPRQNIVYNEKVKGVDLDSGWFGVLIDRTRNRICPVTATQVLFQKRSINGQTVDVVYPLETTGLFWPKLGRDSILRIVPIPKDLPFPGPWFTMTVSIDDCHFWDRFLGVKVRESQPVMVVP